MAKVSFHTADAPVPLRQRTELKTFIEKIFRREGRPLASLNYVFCSDNYLLQINKDFLSHDFYTDIVTFDLSPKGQPAEAEIYISVDRVRDNATNLGLPFQQELLRVVFHGALHLCGYRDKTKSEITIMRNKEDQYLRLYAKQH